MKKVTDSILVSTLNIWFYFWAPVVLLLSLIVYTPFVATVRVFSRRKAMFFFRRCINLYGKSVALTAWPWIRIKVYNLPRGKEAPYIFVENHTSSFDPFVQGFLPVELVQAARGWALSLPVLGLVAKFAGYLDVDALDAEEFMMNARKLLDEGVSIVFFPEGTRYPGPEMGPFHSTAFRLAAETGTPVVPVIISGISDKPRKGSLVMHPGIIEIYCLSPVFPEKNRKQSHMTLKKKIRRMMEDQIQVLQ